VRNKSSELYIGLMSGTSLDGVDAALVDFSKQIPLVAGIESARLAPDLRANLMALNSSGSDELHTAALATNALMRLYAQTVRALLAKANLKPQDIRAIGAHGQTVRHRPQMFDQTGYTIQLCNPSLLAELTGIDVVADFRSRDVAAGGQGAPLAPFFHRAWFAQEAATVGVLNIGGISNLTILQSDGGKAGFETIGFDCGPGNALMDFWCAQHTGQAFDEGGAWGASGQIIPALLEQMLAEPYFALPYPKSTGRDLFNPDWMAKHLASYADAKPQDVQRTLLELTASSISTCASSYSFESNQSLKELIVCGGGAFNAALIQRLQALLPETKVITSAERGLPPQDVEAVAFAWLARQCVERVALPLTSVTGARGARILGGVYPA
jgi:anhydro-N-acetylmuramic acid kinase